MFNFWWLAEQSKKWKLPKIWKNGWKPSKNEMLIFFGLLSTSDDQLSNLSNDSCQKCKTWPPNHQKSEMFIFGLCSTFDDWLSNLRDESHPKCKKLPPNHQQMKCSFLDCVQLLMISWAIGATKVAWNVKKWLPNHQKNEMLVFALHTTSDDWPCNPSDQSCTKCKNKMAKIFMAKLTWPKLK